jgi:hypothetical protein
MLTRTLQLFALACLVFLVGCGQSKSTDNNGTANKQTNKTPGEHADPHDIPLTEDEIKKLHEDTASWAAAVEHIKKFRDTIKTETTGGTPAKAHRALDLLDHVLKRLTEIAQNSNVPTDDRNFIGESSGKLRDAFNSVHENIDAGKAPDYESVAAEIDEAVEALAAIKAE